MMKLDRIYFYSAAIIPWAFILLMLAFYFNAWLILGTPPVYATPDPASMSIFHFYGYITYSLLVLWIIILPLWIIDVIGAGIINRYKRQKQIFVATIAGDLAVILSFSTPVFDWFID